MLTKNNEDYLEAIFHLETEGVSPTAQEIAKHLNIPQASVIKNLNELENEKLLSWLPNKIVKLGPKGKKLAADVVRRHRLSERFLVDKLGVKWEDAHEEAHKLEHGISKVVENKLYEMLGKPETCPHGNPLPNVDGKIKEVPSRSLSSYKKNDKVKIVKIVDEEPKLLCYLATLGLMPKTIVKIEEKAPFDGPLMIKVGNATYALGRKIADSIWGRKE